MDDKKYPVGTVIKYVGGCPECKGKIGKIVEVYKTYCRITLPHSSCRMFRGGKVSSAPWKIITPLHVKNQQLLFSFMY